MYGSKVSHYTYLEECLSYPSHMFGIILNFWAKGLNGPFVDTEMRCLYTLRYYLLESCLIRSFPVQSLDAFHLFHAKSFLWWLFCFYASKGILEIIKLPYIESWRCFYPLVLFCISPHAFLNLWNKLDSVRLFWSTLALLCVFLYSYCKMEIPL